MARYRTYRGKHRRGTTVLIVFIVVLVLAALAVFVLPDYLVYTDEGVRLELPLFGFGTSPSPSGPGGRSSSPSVSVDIIVETPPPTPSDSPSPTPTPEPTVRSLGIPLSLIGKEDKLEAIKSFALAAGISDIALEVKDPSGEMADAQAMKEAVALLRDPALTLTARLSAFRDNTVTRSKGTYGVKHTSGVNWLDNNGERWINPYIPEARQFVIDCALTAGEAGFDRVLLTDVCFPHYGSLSKINYGGGATVSHIAALSVFLDELSERAGGLSLCAEVLEETISSGSQPEAGQELTKFQEIFDTLYYTVPADMSALLSTGVPIFSAFDESLRQRLGQAENIGYLVIGEDGEFPLGAFER